jgi:hypothetical protein
MQYQVNAIFAVHTRQGLVFGSTTSVGFDEIYFEVDAEILPTEVIEWRMELTGLPDTVMGTLKADLKSIKEGTKLSRGELPIYIAKILSMSDRDRELYRSWLEDRSGSKSSRREITPPPHSVTSRAPNSTDSKTSPNSVGLKAAPNSTASKAPPKSVPRPADKGVVSMPEPKTDPNADPWMKTHNTESTSERYGLNDRSSRQRSSLGRQAIRDALRASLGGAPPKPDGAAAPKNDWLSNAGRARSPSFLDERPARRGPAVDEDVGKGAPPEYDLPALDQANDSAQAMGFRARAKPVVTRFEPPPRPAPEPPPSRAPEPLASRAPEPSASRAPEPPPPPEEPTPQHPLLELPSKPSNPETRTDVTPLRADVKVSRDLHVVQRPPGLTARTSRGMPTEPPAPTQTMDSSPSLDEFIRAKLPTPQPAPPKAEPEPKSEAETLPGRAVSVLPKSRPPQVTVHYRDRALFHDDYEKHLKGGGIVIQLPDLDTAGMRAFIRLVLPSGKDVRCRAEVVALLPEGAGVQLQLRPEDKELLRVEGEKQT